MCHLFINHIHIRSIQSVSQFANEPTSRFVGLFTGTRHTHNLQMTLLFSYASKAVNIRSVEQSKEESEKKVFICIF